MDHGGTSPSSVEKKARTLTRQTLDAIRPAAGSAGTSVTGGTWQQCSTETPGTHRFEYRYVVTLDVPQERSEDVMTAARAHFVEQGYRLDLPDPGTARVGATEPHATYWVAVGVNSDKKSMFLSVDSGCVGVSHDPKKKA
ncbi:hypothetical protein SAMN05216223_10579 [Actinacidiphila yanglinensis]|uniref:Uncharacterized protein n=2 Tax=Actinacidiphila yanglinensis TaxID=310779 RepID=A0A1H5ZZX6_9ACTN|nr:hypothetical protein SAMN05216223_10579 [Actinacidiphila yanglinensis]